MKDLMNELKDAAQLEEIRSSKEISVALFSAAWCPDCRFIEPFMPELIRKYAHYRFWYIDRDQWMPLCAELGVMGIPSFIAFQDGHELGRFVSKNRKTQTQIDDFLSSLQEGEGGLAMLEGLKKLIFNTDIDDVSEEGELEEIQLPKKEPEPEAPKPPKPEPQPQPQPEKAAEEEKQAEQEQPFTGIVADDEKEKALRAERKARNEQRMQRQKELYADANAEFEFKPILSPIYGNTADDERKPQDVHDAVHLPKAKTRSTLNTVLSPMYGAAQPQKKSREAEAQPRHAQRSQIREEPQEEVLSLDEMLMKGRRDEREETVQISLFGESTPVRAEKEDLEKVYLTDEKE